MIIIECKHWIKFCIDILPINLPKRHTVSSFPSFLAPSLSGFTNWLVQTFLDKELVYFVVWYVGFVMDIQMTFHLSWSPTIFGSPQLNQSRSSWINVNLWFGSWFLFVDQCNIILLHPLFPIEVCAFWYTKFLSYFLIRPSFYQFNFDKRYPIFSLHIEVTSLF